MTDEERFNRIAEAFHSDFISARVRNGEIYFIDQSTNEVFAKARVECMIHREEIRSPIPDLRDI